MASYREGVRWIAGNDETAESDPEVMATLISVALLADLFRKEPAAVAADVIRARFPKGRPERTSGNVTRTCRRCKVRAYHHWLTEHDHPHRHRYQIQCKDCGFMWWSSRNPTSASEED